jgi:hypothetical protein
VSDAGSGSPELRNTSRAGAPAREVFRSSGLAVREPLVAAPHIQQGTDPFVRAPKTDDDKNSTIGPPRWTISEADMESKYTIIALDGPARAFSWKGRI